MRRGAVVVAVAVAVLLAGCVNMQRPALVLAVADPAAEFVQSGTVLDDGSGPRICTIVLQSDPPQCGFGLPLEGFTWDNAANVDEGGGVKWGDATVRGTWDGETLTLTEPATAPVTAQPRDQPVGTLTQNEAHAIIMQLRPELGDALLGSGEGDGYASITVLYDDGSLQDQLDSRFGPGSVVVESILQPAT